MGWLSKVGDFLTGGLGDAIVETAKEYFPPDLSPQQKAQIELATKKAAQKQERELIRLNNEQVAEFNTRIKEMEGTASDLKQFGWIGKIVIFLRGLQRPFWGFGTFYLDSRWFFSMNEFTERQELALVTINILVLVFLFGERALKNISPLIARILEARK